MAAVRRRLRDHRGHERVEPVPALGAHLLRRGRRRAYLPALVAHFYAGVRTDPVLAPLYPQDDWDGAEARLRGFLEQYWGGPTTYSQERGHPRLRMRHAPFAIGPAERDAWLTHMRAAVDSLGALPRAGRDALGLPGDGRAQHAEPLPRRGPRRPLAALSPRHDPTTTPRGARCTRTRRHSALPTSADWWRDAVFYQIYIRSFADGNGDGVGDLAGIRSRLPYLADLGVDALWITPFYPSPMADHGYDVADPRDVEPVFGDLAEFDALLAEAHALGLRVTIDLVPNHSSHDHEWFRAALAAAPGSAERARYLFRDGPRARRQRAAEQLAVGLRRPGVDAGARRPVVPAHLRAGAARPGLHQPRGARRPRGDDAVLARPRRRRLPDRRGARHGQARGPAGHGPAGGRRPARRPRPR